MSLNQKYYEIFREIENDHEQLSENTTDSNVLLIDGLNTFIRSWSAIPTLNDNGEHIGGTMGFLKSIGYAIRELNPTRVVIVFDGKNSSNKKRRVYSNYKSTRGMNKLRVNRAYGQLSDEEERAQMKRQLVATANLLEYLPVTTMMYDGVEADDVMAYVSRELCQDRSIIMSTDKDFIQLVDEDTYVWSPTKKELYTKEKVLRDYSIPSHNFLLFRVLDGDSSDDIPGIKGAGLKTVIKRLPILLEDRTVTVDELLEYSKNQQGKIKLYDRLVENEDILYRNYDLMQLQDADINGLVKIKIQERFREPITRLDAVEFQKQIVSEKMVDAFPHLHSWLKSTFYTLDQYASKHG